MDDDFEVDDQYEDDHDYEDVNDRPRRKNKRPEPSVWPWVLLAVGGAVGFVVLVGVGLLLVFATAEDDEGKQVPDPVGPMAAVPNRPPAAPHTWTDPFAPPEVPPGPPAPPGFSVAGSKDAGFRVFLPGAISNTFPAKRIGLSHLERWEFTTDQLGVKSILSGSAISEKVAANYTPGNTPEALWADLIRLDSRIESTWNKVESKTLTKLAGRPALEVRAFENSNWMHERSAAPPWPQELPDAGTFPNNMPEHMRQAQEEARRKQREFLQRVADQRKQQAEANRAQAAENQKTAPYFVYYVTSDNKRIYVVKVQRVGGYPDDGTLKTITDSFQFVGDGSES